MDQTPSGLCVTLADIEAEIAIEVFFTAGDGSYVANMRVAGDGVKSFLDRPFQLEQVTFCVLVLRNGTKIIGINYGAIDPAQHSAEEGRRAAREHAIEQVWPLLGFRLRDELARPALTDADAAADLAGTPRPDWKA